MAELALKNRSWSILKTWRPYFLIFLVGFLLYFSSLSFDFTYFDDSSLILDKIEILKNFRQVGQIFATDAFFSGDKFYYRPLLNLSFMVDAQWAGSLPFFYHLSNILLHILAASLVFYLLNLILKRRPLAFFLGLIFLVHPVLTQAVAWLPGRNDSLLAIFVLAALAMFLKFSARPALRYYLGYLLFLFLALLSKESAVGLPLLIIYYFYFIDRESLSKIDKFLVVVGSLATGFIWFLMRNFALGAGSTNYESAVVGIVHNSAALLLSLGKLVWPLNLSVLPILADSTIIYGVLALLLLSAGLYWSKEKRYNYLIFGSLWFLVFLLPSFIRLNDLPDFLEHRLYLPFFGFLIVLAEIDFIKKLDFKERRNQLAAALILILLASLTYFHSSVFSDRLTFWQRAAQDSPHSPLAQRNLGVMYYFAGNFPAAETYYQRALKLNPSEIMVHNNLGVIYLAQKRYGLAESEFRQELLVNPNYELAWFNLGEVAYRQGKFLDAKNFWETALLANPDYLEAYQRLLILENRLR